ncbi:glycosyltransferase family 2 protein [Microbacterium sp. GXF7504]
MPPAPTPLRVSVVIPVKDDRTALRRCLRALALQTRRPDEVVVVDNGCADDSAAVATGAGARLVVCGTPGIPAAAATGYDAATGDVVLRLDADSLPGPRWVETFARAFARNPRVAAFTAGARFVDGPRALRRPLAVVYLAGYALAGFAALGHVPMFGSNMGFRREAWRRVAARVHRDDAELHDDLDLAFHLGEGLRIRYLPGAALGISMRPFHDHRAFRRRVRRGFRTVLRHWPVDFPPMRWDRRFLRTVRRAVRS